MTTTAPPASRRDAILGQVSGSLPWRCARRFIGITGYDRALGLAAQAFIAAIPTVIVVSAVTGGPAASFADRIIDRFGLSGSTADLVRQAFQPPDDTTTTVWSACLLVISGIGFTRAMQRSFRAAWGIGPTPGWRAWAGGMASALALAAAVVAGVAVASISDFDGAGPVRFVLRAFALGALWLLAIRLLLGWRLPWRPFLPGVVLVGVGTSAIWLASAIWLPRAFISQAETYGIVGIFIVLISWLILVALLLVAAAVVSAELWLSRATPPPAVDSVVVGTT